MSIKKVEQNPLRTGNFKLTLNRFPNVQYNCQDVNLPGISLSPIMIDTPVNPIYVGPSKMEYESLNVTFIVQENLENYKEIFSWMTSVTAPQEMKQYLREIESMRPGTRANNTPIPHDIYSDGTIHVLKNSSNVNFDITIRNLFPISLSGIQFVTTSSDNMVLTASATFQIESFDFVI